MYKSLLRVLMLCIIFETYLINCAVYKLQNEEIKSLNVGKSSNIKSFYCTKISVLSHNQEAQNKHDNVNYIS